MASETATTTADGTATLGGNWTAGLLGGTAGGIVFGAMLAMNMPDVLGVAIPSMYGFAPPPNALAGWAIHVGHAAVLGVVFAGLVGVVDLTRASARKQVAAGLGYGVLAWVVLAAVVMPIWLSAVGSPADPPLPNLNPMSLVGHAVYGVVLGAVYSALEDL
jgi:uncharacterized membrane protein YagU involved in acid resistance